MFGANIQRWPNVREHLDSRQIYSGVRMKEDQP
jgi:hypothetical protein